MTRALFEPERHEALAAERWDEDRVKHWLHRFADRAQQHWQENGAFPLHPRDESEAEGIVPSGLYYGAMGVWLALERYLHFFEKHADFINIYTNIYKAYRAAPDTGEGVPSWFLGESAILTRLCLLQARAGEIDTPYENRLTEIVHQNLHHPTREILWGAPGTFLAALFMWEATASSHWREICQQHIEVLFDTWEWFDQEGAWLWEQDLYGKKRVFLGAGHGWVSNIYGLWRAQNLLDDTRYNQLRERTLSCIKTFALSHADNLERTAAGPVNWPAVIGHKGLLLQWCHGAPGMICGLHPADIPELDVWLYKGGLSILEAGPLKKGVALCHGTDGNGFALLYLHQRFQERSLPAYLPPIHWLQRARQFAMHALRQSEAAFAEHGDYRYSLWTGDAGLACFLLACMEPNMRLPGVDQFV